MANDGWMRTLIAIAAIMLAVTPITSVVAQGEARAIDDPEAYAVYAAILPISFSSGDVNRTAVAIEARTSGHIRCPQIFTGRVQGVDFAVLATNFTNANTQHHPLVATSFKAGLQYTFVSDAPDSSAAWSRFPNGKLLKLSAVAFDDTRTLALVGVDYTCGLMCEGGDLMVLHKDDAGHWGYAKDADLCSWID